MENPFFGDPSESRRVTALTLGHRGGTPRPGLTRGRLPEEINWTRLSPMKTVNIHAAKTQLSRLVDEAARGEEIVIARAGRPVARLAPLRETSAPRKPGLMRGKIRIGRDFDAPLPRDVLDAFYDGSIEPEEE